ASMTLVQTCALPTFGGNLDFTHYKMYAETDRVTAVEGRWNGSRVREFALMKTRVQNFEISHGVNLTSLNADYRWRAESHSSFGLIRSSLCRDVGYCY